MTIYGIMVLMHIIGTVLGVGAATFVEINIINALYEGKRDPDKTLIMQITYNTLRIGLLLLFLSGIGFLVYARVLEYSSLIHSAQFWVKLGVVGLIVVTAMLQQLKMIPRAWGSAIAITSWYTALVLGVLHDAEFPVLNILFVYLLTIVCMYYVFSFLQTKFSRVTNDNLE